jgi:hypothetical protein
MRSVARAEVLLWAALAALCLAAVGPGYVNHDAAWYLYMVDRWIHGARLYRDVIDTNPPLIIWVSTPPALVALAGWSPLAAFKIYVFAIAVGTAVASRRMVSRSWPQRGVIVGASVLFVCLPFVKEDFGQREHFAVLLALPYVLMAAGSAGFSTREQVLAGIAGGLGFAIKPHFLVAWVAVEVCAVACDGWPHARRAQALAAAATFAAYGIAVAVFLPVYFHVAAQVREVYGGLNAPTAALIRLREVQVWVVAGALAGAVRWRREDRLPLVLFAAATGFLLAALLQLKGWNYHLYPARVFLALFFVTATLVVVERAPALGALLRGGSRGLAVIFAAGLVISAGRYLLEARHPSSPDLVSPLIEAIHAKAPAGPVAVLSARTFVYPAFPAINYTGARWALRQNSLLFMEGLFASPSTASPTEQALVDELVDDLCRTPPRLLLVDAPDVTTRSPRPVFDVLARLRSVPRLSPVLDAYAADGRIGGFLVLTATKDAACR